MDIRKTKLKKLEKKIDSIAAKYPNIDLRKYELRQDIIKYQELSIEAFCLKFEIEHCKTCSQLLPQYKNK